MSDMTLSEAAELRNEAEDKIYEIVKDYEKRTGLSISGVSITRLYGIDGISLVGAVALDVEMLRRE